MNSPYVLIIDDEAQIRKLLKITLESNGYQVQDAATAKEGLILGANHPPDLILLDLGLPDESGHTVLKKLRDWYSNPIIIISVLNDEENIVKALDGGGNDYIIKPFRTGELLARIRSALRLHQLEENNPVFQCGDLRIDFRSRTVKRKGESIKLTATEYSLLSLFAKNEGKVLTHHYILNQIWGPTFVEQSQYLRVYIAQIRKKIEDDPNRPKFLVTESGVGYRFLANE
jgi:two-component system KDP operon response regulator KdpE